METHTSRITTYNYHPATRKPKLPPLLKLSHGTYAAVIGYWSLFILKDRDCWFALLCRADSKVLCILCHGKRNQVFRVAREFVGRMPYHIRRQSLKRCREEPNSEQIQKLQQTAKFAADRYEATCLIAYLNSETAIEKFLRTNSKTKHGELYV